METRRPEGMGLQSFLKTQLGKVTYNHPTPNFKNNKNFS